MKSETKQVLGRAYSLIVLVVSVAWLFGVVWLGLYNYPRAAYDAGVARHKNLIAQMVDGCALCPLWGKDKVAGVAIVSDGKQILLATEEGVIAIKQEGLLQRRLAD